jgi:SRSO17 transposase
MDAEQLSGLGPMLSVYLRRYVGCFGRREQPENLRRIVQGQLSHLPRKTLEPIALTHGVAPTVLQHFMSVHGWDHLMMRDELQRMVGREHAHPHAMAILDETSHVKKGTKTPGVQRQYCGSRGTTDNCVVTVHLGYAAGDFHCLIDSGLYLPKSWSEDRERCDDAGIPEDMVYRPKTGIALELLDRAMGNGVKFQWVGIDAGYGKEPQFLHELNRRNLLFVADVPPTFHGWLRAPEVVHKEFPGHRQGYRHGPNRKMPRLKVKSLRACSVKNLLTYSPDLRDQEWQKFHIKDTDKGPVVWEVKQSSFYFKLEKAITFEHRLVICRSVTEPDEIKYFVSNAPLTMPLETILAVAFNRWRVEMCFREEKSELGLSHFEVRNYRSLLRHMIVTSVTHLFLAKVREKWKRERGEGEAPDREPAAHGPGRRALEHPGDRSGAQEEIGTGGDGDRVPSEEHRRVDPLRQEESPETPPGSWNQPCEIAILCSPDLGKAAL